MYSQGSFWLLYHLPRHQYFPLGLHHEEIVFLRLRYLHPIQRFLIGDLENLFVVVLLNIEQISIRHTPSRRMQLTLLIVVNFLLWFWLLNMPLIKPYFFFF